MMGFWRFVLAVSTLGVSEATRSIDKGYESAKQWKAQAEQEKKK